MAGSDLFRELICGTTGRELLNLTVAAFGGFAIPLSVGQPAANSSGGAESFDHLCSNASEWDRESLLGNDRFRHVMDDLNVYLTPVIILVGVVGNFATLLVFTMTYLNRQSSSVYLASLAVVDMLFLWCLSMIWLSWVHVNIFHRHVWCQCIVYMTYVCTFLSVWYVVSFTIERYIIVYYPLKKDFLCTRRRAKTIVALLAVLALALYSFAAITNGSISFKKVSMCTPLTRYYTLITVVTVFDFLFTLVIPSAVIIIMNVRIIVKIAAYSKQSMQFYGGEPLNSRGSNGTSPEAADGADASLPVRQHRGSGTVVYVGQSHFTNPRTSFGHLSANARRSCGNITQLRLRYGRARAQYRTARMLIIVSTVFVILNLPNHLFRIHAFLRSSLDDRYLTDLMALKWHELFQLIWHLNFSINFFLYSVCGRQFRTGLRLLCCRFIRKCCSAKEYLCNVRFCKVTDGTQTNVRFTVRLLNRGPSPAAVAKEDIPVFLG